MVDPAVVGEDRRWIFRMLSTNAQAFARADAIRPTLILGSGGSSSEASAWATSHALASSVGTFASMASSTDERGQ